MGKEYVVPELVNCLLDESPGVVREAGVLLAPLLKRVPGDALLKIVKEGSSSPTWKPGCQELSERRKVG